MSPRSSRLVGGLLASLLLLAGCSDDPESAGTATEDASTTTERISGEPSDSTTTTATPPRADDPATPEDEAAIDEFCTAAERLRDAVAGLADRDVLSSSSRFGDQLELIRKEISALRESASDAARPELDDLDTEFGQLEDELRDGDQPLRDLLSGAASEAVDTMSAGLDVVQRLASVCPD